MELVSEAIEFALKAHDGMRRKKGTSPYILHPMEAAVIVGTMTADQSLIAAAVLHDVVEDAGVTIDEVEEKFGKRVRDLVQTETEDKRDHLPPEETWMVRKEESLEVLKKADTDVMIIWLGDKLANMRDIYREWCVEGDAMWQGFHQKDPNVQAWYYSTIAELTKPLSNHFAWIEYRDLVSKVFHNKGIKQ